MGPEFDGMSMFGLEFGSTSRQATVIGAEFTFGGRAIDYSRSVGFSIARGAEGGRIDRVVCAPYGGADLHNWTLYRGYFAAEFLGGGERRLLGSSVSLKRKWASEASIYAMFED